MHLSKKFGSTINEIKKDGFKIYAKFSMLPKEDTGYHMAQTVGKGIINFSKVFRKLQPDINLILGDRDEMLASAIAASHMNIPNAHIHGGDKSSGIDEYNRHAITKLSNLHFAATKKSYQRIIKMGENPKNVLFTGSPSIDEVLLRKITAKKNLEKKYNISFTGKELLLVFHPVTTEAESTKKQINKILNAIKKLKLPTIVLGPNSDAGSKEILENLIQFSNKYKFCQFYRNIPRNDYLGMLVPPTMEGNPFFTEAIKAKALAASAASRANFGKAYKGGVKIAFGTDTGVTRHGANAEEFALMVGAGMSEMDAIRSATVVTAELIEMSDSLGTIEPGKLADMIAVDSSPLDDITVLEHVSAVIKDGRRQ